MFNALFVKYYFLALIWVVKHISTISGSEVIEFWKIVRIFGPKLGYFCTRKIDWGMQTVHTPKQLRRVPRRARAIACVLLTALPPPSGSEIAEMTQYYLNKEGYIHINQVWIKNTWKGRAAVVECMVTERAQSLNKQRTFFENMDFANLLLRCLVCLVRAAALLKESWWKRLRLQGGGWLVFVLLTVYVSSVCTAVSVL